MSLRFASNNTSVLPGTLDYILTGRYLIKMQKLRGYLIHLVKISFVYWYVAQLEGLFFKKNRTGKFISTYFCLCMKAHPQSGSTLIAETS